ncbi:MAG: leucine--tRNA ligase [Verrucomicrobia bacterium]|nr:leucine--tRNA ligase [Verrucomicrobiota bacterium]
MATHCKDYNFAAIEPHWQAYWEQQGTFRAEDSSDRPKYYILDMFPYPSGAGLHAGHAENYTGSDILGRYKLASGYNVLHPMGWDAFGLPAEQYAVKTGTHPAITTARNIDMFRAQIKRLGVAIDWEREINTTDPRYYRWTQWIFLNLFKHGLAYVDKRPVNWCPALGTVLANEEVIDGKSEVGGHPVERRNLRQWVLRITAYADKLLAGLKDLQWPESTKTQQTNWIGRSEGATVWFALEDHHDLLEIYTTRPDTLFGATYMVIAPEHPMVDLLTKPEQLETVRAYQAKASTKSDLDRTELAKEKSGVFTGSYAINPVNGARIPIWIADYVLMGYGTGAIMAVPAHDERDFEFATLFDLPVIRVIDAADASGDSMPLPYSGAGTLVNSGEFDGLAHTEAKDKIVAKLAERSAARKSTNYRLRDWLFSRQRYWGEPFPILWVKESDYQVLVDSKGPVTDWLPPEPVRYSEGDDTFVAIPVPASQLPLTLPETDNYRPAGDGESPLGNLTDWVNVWLDVGTGNTVPQSQPRPEQGVWIAARRETNTMPQWAGSCWYYLRYLDPNNDQTLVDPDKRDYWGSPDFYVGGNEHAVLHLLYARFWHQFLCDIGVLKEPEPFRRLFHQGIILGEDGEKMSKSRGNVVNPDDCIASHGADSLRLYEMFMGPFEDAKPWSPHGIEGVHRFLRKVWRELMGQEGGLHPRIVQSGYFDDPETLRLLHQTIKKVGEDIENLRFNTAIAQMMIFMNHAGKTDRLSAQSARVFVQLLAPFAPHVAEEMWARLGGMGSVARALWPVFDPALLETDEVAIGILINGKPRGELLVAKDAPESEVLDAARKQEKVAQHLEGKSIRKVVYVPGKILNLVAN